MALARRLRQLESGKTLFYAWPSNRNRRRYGRGIASSKKIAETYYEVVPEEREEGQSTDQCQHLLLCTETVYHSSGHRCIHRAGFCGKKPKWLSEIRAR